MNIETLKRGLTQSMWDPRGHSAAVSKTNSPADCNVQADELPRSCKLPVYEPKRHRNFSSVLIPKTKEYFWAKNKTVLVKKLDFRLNEFLNFCLSNNLCLE